MNRMVRHTWKMRDRQMRAWVYENQVGRMVYSNDFTMLSLFYDHLENSDNYDLMDWINESDIHEKKLFEGDQVRVYGGKLHQGFWEIDVSGVVQYRGTSYGIVNADGVFYPFDVAFDTHDDIRFEIVGNVYESATGHDVLEGAAPIDDEHLNPFS
jgi:hypothetical protein